MRFYSPTLLNILWLIPVFILVYVRSNKLRRRKLYNFGENILVDDLSASHSETKYRLRKILQFGIFSMLVLALARPQIGAKMEKIKQTGVDVVVAIDTSRSMLAEDFKPNRLQKAKRSLISFIKLLQGNRIGLVAFAGDAFELCPLTLDHASLRMYLDILDDQLIPLQGTALGDAVETGMKMLKTGPKKASKVIFVLTDGEDHGTNPIEAAKKAAGENIKIYTVGIGSRKGEPIPIRDENGKMKGYKKDIEGAVVLSKLDEKTLAEMANVSGGKYYHATADEMELDRIAAEIQGLEKGDLEEKFLMHYEERFIIPLSIAVIAFIILILLGDRKGVPQYLLPLVRIFRSGKSQKNILIVIFAFNVMIFSSGFQGKVRKSVQKGNELFAEGKYKEALSEYKSVQDNPKEIQTIDFNIGDAEYMLGEFDSAISAFQRSSFESDPEIVSKSLYNSGNTYYKKGDKERAKEFYIKALVKNPDDIDAKYNLEVVTQQIKQQQQQQKQENKKHEENQDKKEQQKEKDQQQDSKENKKDKDRQQDKDTNKEEQQEKKEKKDNKEEKQDQQKNMQEKESQDKEDNKQQEDEEKKDQQQKEQEKRDEEEKQEGKKDKNTAQQGKERNENKMPEEDVERLLDALKDDEQDLKWYFKNLHKKDGNKSKQKKDW
ncbi:MAG: VWA domain-containing protein [Candidatus Theseobacter exili]|nr:VWA domain-containing protein [Candidatus Theseobacter exili]